MRYFRAFVAGFLIPAIFAPFLMLFLVVNGEGSSLSMLPFLYLGPLFWGVWNIIFFTTRQFIPVRSRNHKIGLYGGAYGLLTALLNSLFFDFTSVIQGLSDVWIIASIILYPLALYYVWKYGVNLLNLFFEVY